MKKIILLLLVIPTILFTHQSFFSPGFPYTHDGENHLARFANYKIAVKEGQIPPRFAPNLMNRYGYPVFNYNYPLANILSLPFSALKLNYQMTFKIIVLAFLVFGSLGIYKYLSLINKTRFSFDSKLFAILVYLSSPFIVSAMLFRGSIGEIMAYGLLPWLLWSIEVHSNRNRTSLFLYNRMVFLLTYLTWIMFFISHNITVLFGSVLLITYTLLRYRLDISSYKKLLLPTFLALISTLWFWLPAYYEMDQVIVSQTPLQKEYLGHFPTLNQLVFSPLQFGFSYPGSIDSISFAVGGFTLITLGIYFLIVMAKIIKNRLGNKWAFSAPAVGLMLALTTLVMQLEFTSFIWQLILLAQFIQFPWRLMIFVVVFSLITLAYIFQQLPKTIKIIGWILMLMWLIRVSNLQSVDRFDKSIDDYDAFSQSTTTLNENLPITFSYEDIADWQPGPIILSGHGEIEISHWSGSSRAYSLNLSEESIIVEPTMYFLGWQTSANANTLNYIDNDLIGGRIAFALPGGEYQISTQFTQSTWPRISGNWLSILGIIAVGGIFFIYRKPPGSHKH